MYLCMYICNIYMCICIYTCIIYIYTGALVGAFEFLITCITICRCTYIYM